MPLAWQQLIQNVKKEIREISPEQLHDRLQKGEPVAVIDVRERDEFMNGHLPNAIFIPRGFLEVRIESMIPDRNQEICLYCGGGNRSALSARSLQEMGYTGVHSLAGGYSQWTREGRTIVFPKEPDIDPQ